jgi:hypothetical protein
VSCETLQTNWWKAAPNGHVFEAGYLLPWGTTVASFVGKIPHAKGWWWYWPPSRVAPTQDSQPPPFDAILPHMGTLFGRLTQLCMWVVLCTKWAVIRRKAVVLLLIVKVVWTI